ncbi:MAG: hypothetical protein JWO32_3177, partial [Bacteroidetes bacterium]|nr:hypothetical protein [Bacteroidota bacterium]
MKKLLFLVLGVVVLTGLHSQSLTCLSPTLVFTDPLNANATVPSTVNCDFPGLIRIQTSPSLNGALTQGNSPCLRIQTSLTNANSSTNNSMSLFEGTVNYATICGTCALSVTSNSLYTLYMPGLTPSMSHSIALCNSAVAPNMTYSVYSCYSNVILNSGIWNNTAANSCQTITIPANTAIGSASFVISPTVSAAAINQNFGSGYITLDPWQMAPGVYSITYNFNSQNGCTTSATRTLQIKNPFVTSNFTPPAALCPYSNCVNLLGAVSGYTSTSGFPFFSGTGVSSNSFCPATSGAGTFPVTYEIGPTAICGSTITNNITVNSLPAASAGPTASFTCSNPFTATLSGSGGGTYNWTGPSIVSGGNSANPVVGATGSYDVIVTSAAGCTAQAAASVVQNTTSPTVTANSVSNIITCSNPQATVSIGALSGVTYAWSGPGISGASNGAAITVTAGGNYNVVVTDNVNGCSTNSVNITATQNTTITNTPSTAGSVGCVSSPITLSTTASGPYSYTWTAPSGSSFTSGFNSQTATANSTTGGNFTITVKNGINGCVSTSVIAINVNQTQPSANASNIGVVNCTNTAVNLNSSSAGVTYTWVAPAGSSVGAPNSATTTANGGGTYTLLVTSTANSCTNSAVTAITTQTTRPIANITNNPIISCTNTMVTINGSPGAGVTYNWSGGTISGSSTNVNVNVTSAGIYSLAVTSTSNGCTSLAPATVTISQNNSTPTLSAASQTAASGCGSASVVTLSGNATPAGSTYTWTSGGGFTSGINNSTVSVNSSTTYTLNSTHPSSGCMASLVYTVIASANQPNATASSNTGTLTCLNTSQSTTVTSNPPSGVTYSWTGPGIVGSSNSSVVTGSLAGTYNLVLTNTINSCSTNSLSFVISANNSPVVPNASVSNTVNCISSSATISTAPSGSGPFTYSWSTGPTSSVIVVSPSGNTNYVITVTNTANGCTGTQTVSVTASTNPPTGVSVSPNTATLSCASPNATLTASSTGGTSYSWTPPSGGAVSNATTISTQISGPGIYTLIATGANGCSAAAVTATITPNVNAPTFTVSNSSPSITCNNAAPGVSVTVTSTVPISGYTWTPTSGISGSANNNVVTFTASGIYTGVITATNGCSSTTTISVSNATATPGIVAGTGTAQALSCTNSVVTIAPSFVPAANLTYTWSGPGISGSNSGPSIAVN